VTDTALRFRAALEKIHTSLASLDLPAEVRRADALVKSVSSDRPVKIVVVGEFNSGKSTLVNALCGVDLLPAGIIPTTATINVVQYGSVPSIVAMQKDGTRIELGFVPGALQQFTARRGEHREIQEIQIAIPNLPPDLIVVDTPGVNDINETRSEIVYEMLPEADAIIFLMDIQQPMKRSEVDFLRTRILRTSVVKTVFVLNHIDRVSDEQEIVKAIEYVRKSMASIYAEVAESFSRAGLDHLSGELRRYSGDIPVYTVSAKRMLRSLDAGRVIEGDPQGLRLSILALAASDSRLRTVWNGTTAQAFGLLARLRSEIEEQHSMKRMERQRIVFDARRNGEVLRKTLEATRKTLKNLDLRRIALRDSADRSVQAIFVEAEAFIASNIETSSKAQAMEAVQQEIGRKLEIQMESLNKDIRQLATESARQASAYIPMRVSNPMLELVQDDAQLPNHDWLSDILKDPVYGTGVMMLAPIVAITFGWVGFAVVALPFVVRMFGSESNGMPVEQIRKRLRSSGDQVKAALHVAVDERISAISMAVIEVLDEPQQRVKTACVFLSGDDGPREVVLESLLSLAVELESELVSIDGELAASPPHSSLADKLTAHRRVSLEGVQLTRSHATQLAARANANE
jgi:tRNA U34 5-carboxymethylaminomethyl modifying GTPase MnmE/TrmE